MSKSIDNILTTDKMNEKLYLTLFKIINENRSFGHSKYYYKLIDDNKDIINLYTKRLIELNEIKNTPIYNNYSFPLHTLLYICNFKDLTKLLLEHGIYVNEYYDESDAGPNYDSYTLFEEVCFECDTNMFNYLIDKYGLNNLLINYHYHIITYLIGVASSGDKNNNNAEYMFKTLIENYTKGEDWNWYEINDTIETNEHFLYSCSNDIFDYFLFNLKFWKSDSMFWEAENTLYNETISYDIFSRAIKHCKGINKCSGSSGKGLSKLYFDYQILFDLLCKTLPMRPLEIIKEIIQIVKNIDHLDDDWLNNNIPFYRD